MKFNIIEEEFGWEKFVNIEKWALHWKHIVTLDLTMDDLIEVLNAPNDGYSNAVLEMVKKKFLWTNNIKWIHTQ